MNMNQLSITQAQMQAQAANQAASLSASLSASQSTNSLSSPAGQPVKPASSQAEQFEAMFLQNMINSMFETIEGGGTFGDSNASETWRGMLSEQYAKTVADAGGIGIADSVQRQLLEIQEGTSL